MDRRTFVACAIALFAASLAAEAQQTGKVYRIGFLGTASASAQANRVEALRAGLRDLGYAEGKNIVIEFRWAEGRSDRLPDLAAELVRLKVDVLVTGGTPGILAAKQATTTIPIVMAGSGDAVATGLVASLARPGGNITGSTDSVPELMAKLLELLKEIMPRTRRVAVLVIPSNRSSSPVFNAMESTAGSLKVEPQKFETRGPSEFESAFSRMATSRVDAVVGVWPGSGAPRIRDPPRTGPGGAARPGEVDPHSIGRRDDCRGSGHMAATAPDGWPLPHRTRRSDPLGPHRPLDSSSAQNGGVAFTDLTGS